MYSLSLPSYSWYSPCVIILWSVLNLVLRNSCFIQTLLCGPSACHIPLWAMWQAYKNTFSTLKKYTDEYVYIYSGKSVMWQACLQRWTKIEFKKIYPQPSTGILPPHLSVSSKGLRQCGSDWSDNKRLPLRLFVVKKNKQGKKNHCGDCTLIFHIKLIWFQSQDSRTTHELQDPSATVAVSRTIAACSMTQLT